MEYRTKPRTKYVEETKLPPNPYTIRNKEAKFQKRKQQATQKHTERKKCRLKLLYMRAGEAIIS